MNSVTGRPWKHIWYTALNRGNLEIETRGGGLNLSYVFPKPLAANQIETGLLQKIIL